MRKLKLILFAVTQFSILNMQSQERNCGANIDLAWLQTNAPARYQRFIDLENFTANYINNQVPNNNRLINGNGLIIIPVVVHVLHRGEPEGSGFNISMMQIQSQIDVLNEDFRRLNADAANTPSAFLPVAADIGIEFRLACVDPNGNATNGDVRKYTNTNFFIVAMKVRPDNTTDEEAIGIKTDPNGSVAWPTDRYLNIWVCNVDVLGYSSRPADYSTYPQDDGIVYSSPACLSTTWTVLSGPATLTSAPGVNQATLHATGTGTVVIRAASGNYTTDDNIQVTDVPPPLTGTYFITSNYHNPGTQYTLYNKNSPIWLPANKSFEVSVNITSTEHTSPIWTRASNSYPFNWSTAGPFVSFSGTSGSSVNQQRNAIFNFTAQTSCGTFNGTYTWPVVVASWLRIATSPNPASDNLLVSIEEESSKLTTLKSSENISISLYDFNTNMLVKKWTFNKGERKFNLNIASIMRGQYVLIIRRGKEHGSKQVMLQ